MNPDAISAMPEPVLSFLVLCGDNARYLRECVQSILGQSFIDTEVLLLEDMAGSEAAGLAQAWASADARVRHIRLERFETLAERWNEGIAQSHGDLLWLMPAGHCLASPQVVQDFVTQFILAPSLGFAFCRAQALDEHSTPYETYFPHKKDSDLPYQPTLFPGKLFFSQLLRENPLPAPAVLCRKACYEQVGGFHRQVAENGEWLNWLRFALDWDVFFDPEPKVYCRQPRAFRLARTKTPEALADMLHGYQALEQYIQAGNYPKNFRRQAELARLQFMRRKGMRMSFTEQVRRLYRKLTAGSFERRPIDFNPA